jgi:hypothetical protein
MVSDEAEGLPTVTQEATEALEGRADPGLGLRQQGPTVRAHVMAGGAQWCPVVPLVIVRRRRDERRKCPDGALGVGAGP